MKHFRRAVVVGFDYYAHFLAGLVNEHSKHWRLRAFDSTRLGTVRALLAMRTADALISFGGPAPNIALLEAARRRNIPVLVIWAGSDVLKAQEDPFELEVIKQEGFHHICDGPWLVDELAVLGLKAEYEPVTAVPPGAPVECFPKEFRVLTYLPEPRREFYGAQVVYQAARAMPDVRFDVVGAGSASADAPPNVAFHGVVSDMAKRIDNSVVLLRQPEHDGKSMLVLEALARARHVVWNYDFPHVHTARGTDNVIAKLRELRQLHARGELLLNHDGRTFVLNTFVRADVAARFERRLDRIVREQPTRRTGPRYRVAISGLGLFCAQIAGQVQTVAPEWETYLLRMNSRLQVFTSILTLTQCDVWYSIGSPVPDRWVHLAARLLRKPRVIHWVGSDIATLNEHAQLRALLSSNNVIHLAEVAWTAQQLRNYGFEPRIAPLPPRHTDGRALPLPERFTIMLYVPRTRSDFYGKHAFERLMRRLQGEPIRYLIVGGGEIDAPPGADIVNLGWRDDLHDVYADVSTLIRYTPHDGLSLMVLEALSFGRHVLWTQQFPFVRTISGYSDMESEVRALLARHRKGELRPQHAASLMVQDRFAPAACTRAIAQAWSDALHPQTPANLAVETTG
jgi:glycosyltransferase involved in cell wall biosynthesis